jgi:hypothetical protein
MKKIISSLIVLFLSAALWVLMIYGMANYLEQKKKAQIEQHKSETIGSVISVGYSKTEEAKLSYIINGKQYFVKTSTAGLLQIGEQYKIIYDYTTPTTATVLLPEPLFLSNQVTAITIGTITRLHPSGIYPDLKFSYNVNGNTLIREQSFYDISQFKVGQKYTVEYLLTNPQIAILHMAKPIP